MALLNLDELKLRRSSSSTGISLAKSAQIQPRRGAQPAGQAAVVCSLQNTIQWTVANGGPRLLAVPYKCPAEGTTSVVTLANRSTRLLLNMRDGLSFPDDAPVRFRPSRLLQPSNA